MKSGNIKTLVLLAVVALLVGFALPAAAQDISPVLNEYVANHTGTDNYEYIEVFGAADTDYSALSVLEIEGDGSSGTVDGVFPVGTTDAGGFWVTDFLSNEIENGTITLLLVEDFTGAAGDDLDADDDGTVDAAPWTALLDAVAVTDGDAGDLTYADVVLVPEYDGMSFSPGGASRIPNGTDTDTIGDWVRNDFDGAGLGTFTGTPEVGEALNTPGAVNELVEEEPPTQVVSIMDIQGTEQFSPYDGQVVETSGIVTLYTANGASLWLQDPVGDGDPATSDGIFVSGGGYPDEGPAPAVGDEIRIVARVNEQQFGNALPLTRLTSVAFIEVLSSGNTLPTPVELVDLPNVSMQEGIEFWESLEGMLISVSNAVVVAPTNGFGEVTMLARRDARPGSGYYPREDHVIINVTHDGVVDYNPERIMADDSSLETPITAQVGDRMRSFVGAVDYTFGMYKIQPLSYDLDAQPIPDAPVSMRTGRPGNLTITTFNVENLFDLVDNPDKEDEGSTPTPEELEVQLTKLALAIELELETPDIIIVEETENTEILQELGDRVNTATGTAYTATSFETSDVRGIEVGFLWNANTVSLLDAYQLTDDIVPGVSDAFGASSDSPGREPIVGVFEVSGHELTIIGNHFKSKGGDDPLYGVNWPPERTTEEQRKLQAQVVRDFVNMLYYDDLRSMILVAGDLNDFPFPEPGEGEDDPVSILEGGSGEIPLVNLIRLELPAERYTYVYDGNSEVLDHMLVSPTLAFRLAGVDILHFNTNYPAYLQYDPTTTLSVSDHDPVEGRFIFR